MELWQKVEARGTWKIGTGMVTANTESHPVASKERQTPVMKE